MAVALLRAVPGERDGTREERSAGDHGVVLALLAAGVGAGGLEAGDDVVVQLEPEELGGQLGRVDGDDGGAAAAAEELVKEHAAGLLPQRQVAAQAGDLADTLDPVAVALQVDVAEHGRLHALAAQLVEERDERGLVPVPRGGAGHERDAEGGGLLLEQRERQAVAAADEAVLVQHADDGGRLRAAAHGALHGEVGVLAAAPRDEDAGAGDGSAGAGGRRSSRPRPRPGARGLIGERRALGPAVGGRNAGPRRVTRHGHPPSALRQEGQMPYTSRWCP